jgi:prepilin-type N-terminal cleavage/methylation domain-containing protein
MKRGFSLVELSIVLVILGLLTGGILAGQSLIRASELRSYVAATQRIATAQYSFRDKYFAWPGDMTNATAFWGVLAGTGKDAVCQDTEATSTATCNGNGDGWVNGSAVSQDERFRYWQHLANAGLVEGSYTGRTDSATSGSFVITPGKNAPTLPSSATMTIYAITSQLGTPFTMAGNATGNYLEWRGSASSTTSTSGLLPAEQWNLDTKLDDGKPGYGKLHGPKASWVSPPCTTTDIADTSEYILTSTDRTCRYNYLLN